MHYSRSFGSVRKSGLLLYRQSVYIGTQSDNGRLAAPDNGDKTCPGLCVKQTYSGIEKCFPQIFGRFILFQGELRVTVQPFEYFRQFIFHFCSSV